MSARPSVLFICPDPVGAEMAGLGIRHWELASAVRDRATVTIAHGGGDATEEPGLRTVPFRPHDPRPVLPLIGKADLVVAPPQWPTVAGALRRARARVVYDLYDPETLETLELLTGRPLFIRRQFTATTLDRLHRALRDGHHFMCASETQRDLWLGALLALRTIDPAVYDRDPGYRSVIDLVPFGVPSSRPVRGAGPGPRELLGLSRDREIVLWNGGIWQWLDPTTAVRALAALRETRPRAVLVFMGGAGDHPAARRNAAAAAAVARECGLLGSGVIFHDGWVPYRERQRWLLDADCAIAAAHDHLETRFAFRTRLLDCFWAGLPVACTTGDELASRVAREDLGAVAPPGEARALAHALERILERGRADFAPQLRGAAERATWTRAAAPLRRWIDAAAATGPDARAARPAAASALRPPVLQRLRDGAYLAVGRRLLDRRRST
ncbi:MAG TPA: glycosyltransferase [Solirubrobacteraceae bacterium]|nr:glycosyltransferase [Solirubrobacteraceae bacterium]